MHASTIFKHLGPGKQAAGQVYFKLVLHLNREPCKEDKSIYKMGIQLSIEKSHFQYKTTHIFTGCKIWKELL
jgi:hypothetical protein